MITAATKARLWNVGAIAIFCGLPLLLIVAIVSNVMEATDAADLTTQNLVRTASIITQLEKRRVRAITPVDAASLYLTSASESLARAEIQERAIKLVGQSGGRVIEAQLTTTQEQEAAGTVAIQISLDIDNKGLLDLLYAVESGLPLLYVTDLHAQRTNAQTESGDNVGESLRVDMVLQGHWRKGTG